MFEVSVGGDHVGLAVGDEQGPAPAAGNVAGQEPGGAEIHEGLQVVENWNSANDAFYYGKDGDLTGPDREHQEVSMLALHLLQATLVHVNTLLVQRVLVDPAWATRLTDHDRRALSACSGAPRSTTARTGGCSDRSCHPVPTRC